MINGVNAYQQTVNLQQLSQTQNSGREAQTVELRERDRDRDDTTVSRTRNDPVTRGNGDEQTRNDRSRDLENVPTQAGGKDAAQRRGSVLDVTV